MIKAFALSACVAIVGLVAAVSASAQGSGFTPQMAATYQSECTAGGADPTLCSCIWGRIQGRMTAPEYTALDTATRAQQLHPSLAKYELAIGECNGTSRITVSNPESYPGHISANFVRGCTSGGVSQAICHCAMNEFERQFTLQEFVEQDRLSSWGRQSEHRLYPQFVSIVRACVVANP